MKKISSNFNGIGFIFLKNRKWRGEMMDKETFLKIIKGRIIVSCQALEDEPLHGPEYMAKMSLAAKMGGAVAIRANTKEDIMAIRKETGLPTIGIVKRVYSDSDVYITPTFKEVIELIESGTDVIALDATSRKRPQGITVSELISFIRKNSNCLIMGDVSTVEEGKNAVLDGCDLISTTMSGYTPYSRHLNSPDFELIKELTSSINLPVIAEGKVSTPEDAVNALLCGSHSVVVGTAITRPQEITRWFVEKINNARKMA
jgi:N-acylglucosamine-6-phosphate 2-epimerase